MAQPPSDSPDTSKSRRLPVSARRKIMDLIARRDHSETELRKKLRDQFSAEQIEDALAFARDNQWLAKPEVLSERMASALHRKVRGIRKINQKLHEKGLPRVSSDPDQELEKALKLARTRWPGEESPDKATREKIGRFLLSRGFENSIVRKVVYEKL